VTPGIATLLGVRLVVNQPIRPRTLVPHLSVLMLLAAFAVANAAPRTVAAEPGPRGGAGGAERAATRGPDLETAVDELLDRLVAHTGCRLDDDVALLLFEAGSSPAGVQPSPT
jgi:hypothetical protein